VISISEWSPQMCTKVALVKRLALFGTSRSIYIHQVNRVNFRNTTCLYYDDSTINIVLSIIIIVFVFVVVVVVVVIIIIIIIIIINYMMSQCTSSYYICHKCLSMQYGRDITAICMGTVISTTTKKLIRSVTEKRLTRSNRGKLRHTLETRRRKEIV